MNTSGELHLAAEQPAVVYAVPLSASFWLILVVLTLLASVGAGFWYLWLASLPASELANPTWFFLCH